MVLIFWYLWVNFITLQSEQNQNMNSNKETIQHLKNKIGIYQSKIDAFLITIHELESEPENGFAPKESAQLNGKKIKANHGAGKLTRRGWMAQRLRSDDIPQTTRELFDAYCKETGKESKFITFAGNVSQILSDYPDEFKRHEFKNRPVNQKYYIGVAEWFDGNKLKHEYLDKIKNERE